MNLQAHAINASLQVVKVDKIQSHFVCGSHWNISVNFNAYLTIFSPHIIILCIFGKAPHCRNPWQSDLPHKVMKEIGREPKGELIRLSDVISHD